MNDECSKNFQHSRLIGATSGTGRISGMPGNHRYDSKTSEQHFSFMSGIRNIKTRFRNHIQNLYNVLHLGNMKAQELLIFAFSKISWEYGSALILEIWNWYDDLLKLKKKEAKKALPTILKAIRVISEGSQFEAAIVHGGPDCLQELIAMFCSLQKHIFCREKIAKPRWSEPQCDALALMANVFKALCKIGCLEEEQSGMF